MTTFEERFYKTPFGWFRREGMICAPVHVQADSPIAVLGTPDEARESNCRSSDSRGGRTIKSVGRWDTLIEKLWRE